MARTAQTDVAILGALSIAPMTGYEVRAAIGDVLGDFWHESFGQIYPTLARLEASGAVRRTAPGRTSGSRFEITPVGLQQLRDRLAEPFSPSPARNPLLLRLFFGDNLPPGRAEELLGDEIARAERALARYGQIRADIEQEPSGRDRTLHLITVGFGEQHARAHLQWARESLAALTVRPTTGGGAHA